ncbi:gamma-glutamyl-gamma-aminobutyrate hydrolase family protein [Hamadaea tsunoensis]|uniref:gamma-glutamyl-gamma-aminobutyrate hydrolase family protein n=1 Tax=Hamadaea tsunoensis TaxID=53368 RepID=UPI000488ECDF|nr:gamma-glutamyl-gamma-aminobutyrate hydrolase family protein [Hamadaea tsunoensis]
MTRPIIGLTTYAEPASWALYRDVPAMLLHQTYVHRIQAAGGRPVLLPPDDVDDAILDRLDGLVLTGGADIDPAYYGAVKHEATHLKPGRDPGELILARGALARDLPVLGVCRGMQLLAVATGGALHQHLPEFVGTHLHRPAPFDKPTYGEHVVHLEPDTRCHSILGGVAKTNSLHHQAVADPGTFTAVGWCIEDGVIEAMEDPAHRFAVAIQWHPEAEGDPRLFEALVASASGTTPAPLAA